MYKLVDKLSFRGLGPANEDVQVYLNERLIGLGPHKRILLDLKGISLDEALKLAAEDLLTGALRTDDMPIVADASYGAPITIDSKAITENPRTGVIKERLLDPPIVDDTKYVALLFGEYDGNSFCHTIVRIGQHGVEVLVTSKTDPKYIGLFVNGEIRDDGGTKTLRVYKGKKDFLEEKL